MTFAPATLLATQAYWRAQGGVSLGIVGDTGHVARGVSYHLGRDQLAAGAYSAKTARDRAGLTNAASAIDLGKLDGTLRALRMFSVWLVESQCRRNAPGTSDIREVIYSPDGATVLRWDRERGYQSAPQGGEADDTHLTHTHVSWYRDAEKRDHSIAFRPYFEDDMGIAVNLDVTHDPNPFDALGTATLPTDVAVRRVRDDARIPLSKGTDLGIVQLGTLTDGGAHVVVFNHAGELHLTGISQVTFAPMPAPGPGPAPDCTDAVRRAIAAEHERIAVAAGQLEAGKVRGL